MRQVCEFVLSQITLPQRLVFTSDGVGVVVGVVRDLMT